jgi:hypothetical protein
MIAAYVLTAIGCAVIFLGPHVALDEYSPLRLGAIVTSLAGTACVLSLVSFRYPESRQGNQFRVAIAIVSGFVATGALLWFAGLFDADFNVLGTQAVARWLTHWEGGWGQSRIAAVLSMLPAVPAMELFGYLFNADPSIRTWLQPVPIPKRRSADRNVPGAPSSGREGGMKFFAKVVVIFGILGALFVGFISFAGIVDNMNRNFAPGVIAMAISAAVIVLAGGLLLRNSK